MARQIFAGKEEADRVTIFTLPNSADFRPPPTSSRRVSKGEVPADEEVTFWIALQKAQGQILGINIEEDKFITLRITGVLEGGLVDDWNNRNPDKAVQAGDHIIEVNNVGRGDARALLEKVKTDTNLMVRILRKRAGDVAGVLSQRAAVPAPSSYDLPQSSRTVLAVPTSGSSAVPQLSPLQSSDTVVAAPAEDMLNSTMGIGDALGSLPWSSATGSTQTQPHIDYLSSSQHTVPASINRLSSLPEQGGAMPSEVNKRVQASTVNSLSRLPQSTHPVSIDRLTSLPSRVAGSDTTGPAVYPRLVSASTPAAHREIEQPNLLDRQFSLRSMLPPYSLPGRADTAVRTQVVHAEIDLTSSAEAVFNGFDTLATSAESTGRSVVPRRTRRSSYSIPSVPDECNGIDRPVVRQISAGADLAARTQVTMSTGPAIVKDRFEPVTTATPNQDVRLQAWTESIKEMTAMKAEKFKKRDIIAHGKEMTAMKAEKVKQRDAAEARNDNVGSASVSEQIAASDHAGEPLTAIPESNSSQRQAMIMPEASPEAPAVRAVPVEMIELQPAPVVQAVPSVQRAEAAQAATPAQVATPSTAIETQAGSYQPPVIGPRSSFFGSLAAPFTARASTDHATSVAGSCAAAGSASVPFQPRAGSFVASGAVSASVATASFATVAPSALSAMTGPTLRSMQAVAPSPAISRMARIAAPPPPTLGPRSMSFAAAEVPGAAYPRVDSFSRHSLQPAVGSASVGPVTASTFTKFQAQATQPAPATLPRTATFGAADGRAGMRADTFSRPAAPARSANPMYRVQTFSGPSTPSIPHARPLAKSTVGVFSQTGPPMRTTARSESYVADDVDYDARVSAMRRAISESTRYS